MVDEALKLNVQSLQYVYTVVLALSLGEAFKQFVADSEKRIHWDRTLSLFAFLVMIIPFFQGMNRYLYETYQTGSRPQDYAGFLLIDCIVFTVEGSLFFILSRSLNHELWVRFYTTVLILLSVDIVWGSYVWHFHTSTIKWWVLTNLIGVILMGTALYASRKVQGWWGAIFCTLIVLFRSIADYVLSWPFYFPL